MATVQVRSLATWVFALTLIGWANVSIAEEAGANRNKAVAQQSAAGRSAEAQAYVAQFTKKNPDACFKNVDLKDTKLQGQAGGIGPRVPPTRVIVMIDGSGSMAGRMGGRTKLELAREAALGFVNRLPASVQASLLVFGQQGNNTNAGKAKSCSTIDVLAPMSTDRGPLRRALGQVHAVGWTPLAAGLDRAEALLGASSTPGEQIIYVVSDGEETCGGDPVASARRINGGRTRAIVNVIGFNLPSSEAAKLRTVAQAGGGAFVNVSNQAELDRVTAEVRESLRRTDNEVATSLATTDNDVATSIAITDADTCISNLTTDEDVAMSLDLTDRAVSGRPVPFQEEAKALLKARHDALRARLQAYRAQLIGAEAAAKKRIDAAADAAR